MTDSTDLRYPIGNFEWLQPDTPEASAKAREEQIDVLAKTPLQMRSAVQGLSASQLDTPYRPEGWTVRQVVHHVPDSHMNAYIPKTNLRSNPTGKTTGRSLPTARSRQLKCRCNCSPPCIRVGLTCCEA